MTANDLEHALGVRYAPPARGFGRAVALLRSLSDPLTWGRDVRSRIERLLADIAEFEALLTPPPGPPSEGG